MSLSICLITVDPAARVAAILEPLLPHAEEIVIAADSRVDEETLAGYAALADRLFKIEFCQSERHLAWLFAQCSGDWILRLDGDEVPSPAFVRRLSSMLASRNAQQFWIAQAWLYPDAGHVLTGAPTHRRMWATTCSRSTLSTSTCAGSVALVMYRSASQEQSQTGDMRLMTAEKIRR